MERKTVGSSAIWLISLYQSSSSRFTSAYADERGLWPEQFLSDERKVLWMRPQRRRTLMARRSRPSCEKILAYDLLPFLRRADAWWKGNPKRPVRLRTTINGKRPGRKIRKRNHRQNLPKTQRRKK
jgi:hypothetical protein